MTREASCINAGVDTMTMTYDAPVPQTRGDELERWRREADVRTQRKDAELVVELAGQPWAVGVGCAKPYRWIFYGRGDASGIDVTVKPSSADGGEGVRVELHQEPLWALGAGACVELARQVAEELSANPATGEIRADIDKMVRAGERTSRLDLCGDIQGVKLAGYDDEMASFITRIRRRARHTAPGRSFTGYVFGTGKPLMGRLYDKRVDMAATGKNWLERLVWRRSPDYRGDQPVTRAECQSRGALLRQLGYTGWKPQKLPDIWAWWWGAPGALGGALSARQRAHRAVGWELAKDTNRRRWPLAWWWPTVQEASTYFGGPPVRLSGSNAG